MTMWPLSFHAQAGVGSVRSSVQASSVRIDVPREREPRETAQGIIGTAAERRGWIFTARLARRLAVGVIASANRGGLGSRAQSWHVGSVRPRSDETAAPNIAAQAYVSVGPLRAEDSSLGAYVDKTEARKHGRPMSVLARHLLDGYPRPHERGNADPVRHRAG